ncbi:MAG TPA: hypothetical protein ENK91_11315, partial [Bacteroidetes bacterium]|nr:hypothetical protein [Bacteroidota bacterium]
DNFITSSFKYYLIATKNNNNTINDYMEFAFKYPRISKLLIFENNYKIYKRLKSSMSKKNKIIYLNRQLKANIDEKISLNSFVINTQTFTEAQNHNIGLNKKVCINSKGKIKNFLTHEKDFGNIQHHKLSEVVDSSSFRNLWNISNDKIEKCKDCQYRYMCLSNSDIEEKAGKFYKINSCTFNPYLNKWK